MARHETLSRPLHPSLILWTAALFGAAGACSPEDGKKSDPEAVAAECDSARTYFAREVWAPVMGQICIDCHAPGGLAPAEGADFQLMPPGYPGFLDANFTEVQRVSRLTFEGKSQLLQKPRGEMNHGGGRVLNEDSEEYAALTELVNKLESLEACDGTAAPAALPELTLMGPAATLRKASLHLVGELPSPEAIQAVVDGGDEALRTSLTDLLAKDAFYERLTEIYNDLFLTDKYLSYNGHALNVLNEEDFPVAGAYYDTLPEEVRREVNLSVAREPLDLIAYIVKNDRPFTEILTANFTVVSSATAQVYNIDPPTGVYGDYRDFREARRLVARDGGMLEPPHAGILTSPMFLNRFPTTPTNRNRHRARKIFEFFLATNILEIAERPIDPTESAKYINPTRDDGACNQCHRLIDPVAGAFMMFDENDVERYQPSNEWHPEMFAPGFGDEVMELADFGRGPAWLAERIVADPRFPLSVVYTLFRALVGHDPAVYPADSSADDYGARLAAWEAQEATFRSITSRFVDSNYNLKVAIVEILLSPYFRAVAPGQDASDSAVDLSDFGATRLSTPERLSRKISAVTGVPWARGWDGTSWLTSDYRILYGGIDSDNVVTRLTQPNGIMAAVQWRMANEVACAATAWDFLQPRDQRHLFRHAELTDTPDTGAEAVRRNIQYLHAQILGEDLALDDPELERTYRLFEETYREGIAKVAADELSDRIHWECQGRRNPVTREDLPEEARLVEDDNYVARSWLAVITYLLSDFRFLYE